MSLSKVKRGDTIIIQQSARPNLLVGTQMVIVRIDSSDVPLQAVNELTNKTMWFKRDGWGMGGTVQAVPYVVYLSEEPAPAVPKAAWYHTREGVAWLHKNIPLPPEELRVYRRGQVFRVEGFDTPFMLAAFDGAGGERASLVSLLNGNRYGGRSTPHNLQYTHENISYLFGGRRFELVAESAEEYFKEVFSG